VSIANHTNKHSNIQYKKLSYRRETARQLRTSFSARALIVHFTEHRICRTAIEYTSLNSYRHYQLTNSATYVADKAFKHYILSRSSVFVSLESR